MGTETARGWANTKVCWGTASFIIGMHLAGIAGIVHLALAFSWWTLLLGVIWYYCCGLAISAGYHRLFAHRAYQASFIVRALLLAFGAAAFQQSALKWCAEHRVHHRHTDGEKDPYSVRHGFWWAHFGWVISDGEIDPDDARPRDLEADPLVRLQEKYWFVVGLVLGVAIPGLIGLTWGDPWGAMLFAGATRIAITWQFTYAVNSVAHCFGKRSYSKEISARDSYCLALVTFGEGYHNYHHRFQSDYRNGVRWFHYDPTKWMLWLLARVRLVRNLKRAPRAVILRSRAEASA